MVSLKYSLLFLCLFIFHFYTHACKKSNYLNIKESICTPVHAEIISHSTDGNPSLFVHTNCNILASIDYNTGNIQWKKFLNRNAQINTQNYIYVFTLEPVPTGYSFNAFDKTSGLMVFDTTLDIDNSIPAKIFTSKTSIIIFSHAQIYQIFIEHGKFNVTLPKISVKLNDTQFINGMFINETFHGFIGSFSEIQHFIISSNSEPEYSLTGTMISLSPESFVTQFGLAMFFKQENHCDISFLNLKAKQIQNYANKHLSFCGNFEEITTNGLKSLLIPLNSSFNGYLVVDSNGIEFHDSKNIIPRILVKNLKIGGSSSYDILIVDKIFKLELQTNNLISLTKSLKVLEFNQKLNNYFTVSSDADSFEFFIFENKDVKIYKNHQEFLSFSESFSNVLEIVSFGIPRESLFNAQHLSDYKNNYLSVHGIFQRFVFRIKTHLTLMYDTLTGLNVLKISQSLASLINFSDNKNTNSRSDSIQIDPILIISKGGILTSTTPFLHDVAWSKYIPDFSPNKNSKNALFEIRGSQNLDLLNPIFALVGVHAQLNLPMIYLFDPVTGKSVFGDILSHRSLCDLCHIKNEYIIFNKTDSFSIFITPESDIHYIHDLYILHDRKMVSIFSKTSITRQMPAKPIYYISADLTGESHRNLTIGEIAWSAENSQYTCNELWTRSLPTSLEHSQISIKDQHEISDFNSWSHIGESKYLRYNNHSLFVLSFLHKNDINRVLEIQLIDLRTSSILYSVIRVNALPPIKMVISDNFVAIAYVNSTKNMAELLVIEIFQDSKTKYLKFLTNSFSVLTNKLSMIGVTKTKHGFAHQSLLLAAPGYVSIIPREIFDARRSRNRTSYEIEDNVLEYQQYIFIDDISIINENHTIHDVEYIQTFPTSRESTSIICAASFHSLFCRVNYGLQDQPFDTLRDDFSHITITLITFSLIVLVGVIIHFQKRQAISLQWT